MKIYHTALILFLFLFLNINSYSSQDNPVSDVSSNALIRSEQENTQPCISTSEYEEIGKQCSEYFRSKGNLNTSLYRTMTTSLSWPLRAANGFDDCSFYFISAYIDHDTTASNIRDFNCGTNTYDGHHGTDIAVWPFGFYKMDNSLVEVIAAAAGTIIAKADGNFDRNCSSNNMTANYVIIQHADGSCALYWHMKKNSVTSKTVGQTVMAGEYLGVVGSSGSASGPHLHFEVWSGSTNSTYNDPFGGNCNTRNATSWWISQKNYTEPAIIKASVNTTDIVLPGCPTTETPNESSSFQVPFQGPGLPAGYAKFYIFIRNETNGMTADCKILNPNGSTFNSWTYTSTSNNKTYIKGWSKLLPTIPGTYSFNTTYNGITCARSFDITSATAISTIEKQNILSLFPNPSKGKITIQLENEIYLLGNCKFEIYNVLGEQVYQSPLEHMKSELSLDIHKGLYYYLLKKQDQVLFTGKLMMQ